MTKKRKLADAVIPGWTRYLMPQEFEFVTSLPADVVSDRLYEAFGGGEQPNFLGTNDKLFKRRVLDERTLRCDFVVEKGRKETHSRLLATAILRDTEQATRVHGVAYVSPVFAMSRLLVVVAFVAIFLYSIAAFSVITSEWGTMEVFIILMMLGFLAFFLWSFTLPVWAYRQLRRQFVYELEQTISDGRKASKGKK